jgi:hypothetical protein
LGRKEGVWEEYKNNVADLTGGIGGNREVNIWSHGLQQEVTHICICEVDLTIRSTHMSSGSEAEQKSVARIAYCGTLHYCVLRDG